jgi:hypothetical protein
MKMRLAGGRIIKIAIVTLLAIPAFECETTEQQAEETLPLTQDAPPVRGLRSTKKSSKDSNGSKTSKRAGFLNEDLVDEFEDLFNMVHESRDFSITLSTISYKSSKKASKGKGKGGSSRSNKNLMQVENLSYAEASADVASGTTTISKKGSKKSALNSLSQKAEQKMTRSPVAASSDSSRSR